MRSGFLKNQYFNFYTPRLILETLPIKKNQLKILLIVAAVIGSFGVVITLLTSSLSFLLFTLPNLSLAAFFGYKYKTFKKLDVKPRRKK